MVITRISGIVTAVIIGAGLLAGCSAAQSGSISGTQTAAQASTAALAADNVETAKAELPAAGYRTAAPALAQVNIVTVEDEDLFMQTLVSRLKKYLVSNQFAEENIEETQTESSDILEQVKEKAETGSNLLIVDCSEEDNAPEITDAAVNAGIPLIYIGTEPSAGEQTRWEENEWKVTYIGTDESEISRIRSGILEKISTDEADANENGRIDYIALAAQDDSDDNNEYGESHVNDDTVDAMEKAGIEMKELDAVTVQSDRDLAKAEIGELIGSYSSDIEVILCSDDTLALGAADALEEDGSKVGHEVYVIGADASAESLERVRTGDLYGTVTEDILLQAQYAADAARSMVQSEAVDYRIQAPAVAVTADNAQEILDVIGVND